MKTVIENQESKVYELAKSILYSFQVLMVGIAIPLLFIIGISNNNQKPAKIEESTEVNTTQFSSQPIRQLNIARI